MKLIQERKELIAMALMDAYKMVFGDLQNIPWRRGGLDSDVVSNNFIKNMNK